MTAGRTGVSMTASMRGGQNHPSLPSSHHPPLLVANLTTPHPAVILYSSCWKSYSPLISASTFSLACRQGGGGGRLRPLRSTTQQYY